MFFRYGPGVLSFARCRPLVEQKDVNIRPNVPPNSSFIHSYTQILALKGTEVKLVWIFRSNMRIAELRFPCAPANSPDDIGNELSEALRNFNFSMPGWLTARQPHIIWYHWFSLVCMHQSPPECSSAFPTQINQVELMFHNFIP